MRFPIGAVFIAVLVAGSMVRSLRAQDHVVHAPSAASKLARGQVLQPLRVRCGDKVFAWHGE
jgi:hypothetical protein